MSTHEAVLTWARSYANELQKDMHWEPSDGIYGGFWRADEKEKIHRIIARATAALEFFSKYAGENSQWTQRAREMYESSGGRQSRESGVRALGDMLLEWAAQVESGVIEIRLERLHAELDIVATDLLGQVRRLNSDQKTHPAGAIMLAGAGLEIGLRAAAEASGLELADGKRPTISAWAQLLRSNNFLTVQDIKDIEQVAGLRNSAAHGNFSDLSRERASLMEQQINLILARLGSIIDKA